MGNCQAAEAGVAAIVVQHPGGKAERLYWPTSAAEVMRNNPGHYVALVMLLRVVESDGSGGKQVRLTRVKLLKPKDSLLLGQIYRLITSQEVTKALRQRKHEKLKKLDRPDYIPKSGPKNTGTSTQRSRQNWLPSLQSIDEVGT